ncbi:MAG: amino acid permease, partial [Bacteroidota bacterium]
GLSFMVIAGIMGATISSALGSILGAPRILQATAVDKITPRLFGKGSGKTNEPRNALLLTFVIAEMGILIGELDAIASIVSIFFITTYGFLNISAAFERWTSSDFRPEFKISGWISVIGALACILVMIQLNFVAMLGAIALLSALFFYLKNRELRLESGDAWSGVWASLVKTGLTRLTRDKLHNRNWRPNVIMFSGNPNTRKYMIQMGKAISGNLGILSAFELVEGGNRLLAKTSTNLYEEEDALGYFHYRFNCKEVYAGMDSISRLYGFSGVEPNTILMGWSRNPRSKDQFIDLLKGFDQNGYNTIFLDYSLEKKFGRQQSIDIWWSGHDQNLSFAIRLVEQIANSGIWSLSQIRLLIVNPVNAEAESVYRATSALLRDFRVEAEVRVVNNEIDPRSRKAIIHEESAATDLVILGISDADYKKLGRHYDEISDILDGVGSAMVINASNHFESFEVVSDSPVVTATESSAQPFEMTLPELRLSRFPEVASDVEKLSENGRRVLELFYRKTFTQIAKDRYSLIADLKKRISTAKKELVKIHDLPEHLRRKKAIDKLKNDAFFKVNAVLKEKLGGETLSLHQEKLFEGIEWYVNRLKTELKKFPEYLKLVYDKEDFAPLPGDRAGLKAKKYFKKIKHGIVGPPFTSQVNYREVARYYQYQNRLRFMQRYLEQFLQEELTHFDYMRDATNRLFTSLDILERKINANDKEWYSLELLDDLEARVERFEQDKQALEHKRLGRLQLEYTRNLQHMSDELSQVDVNHLVDKKLGKDKYHRGLESFLNDFPDLFAEKARTRFNLMLIELSVNATMNRMDALQDGFLNELLQLADRKYLRELEQCKEDFTDKKELFLQGKAIIGADMLAPMNEIFKTMLSRMQPLVDDMPEQLEIYAAGKSKDAEDSVEVPIARMMDYYFKSRYQLPVEEEFERLTEGFKRSSYAIRDVLSLVELNLENAKDADVVVDPEEIFTDASRKIDQEISQVKDQISQFSQSVKEKFTAVFQPLSSIKIEESAKEFSSGLMVYQSQQVVTGVNKLLRGLLKKIQILTSKVLYSRSEAVLLARKLKEAEGQRSSTSKMLDLREQVNPQKSVLSVLPQYYVPLFNGKSSIGRDFWVSRPTEEVTFRKALKRYREGYRGGMLVIGERNSGKTAFCRHMSAVHLKSQHVFTVFAPAKDGANTEAFEHALSKATGRWGDAEKMIGSLPAGSTLIINDMELFWERSQGGDDVLKMLYALIDQFSEKVLFICNINPFAWQLINKSQNASQYFIEEILLLPFDAESLRDLVMKRHQSSGMTVCFDADEPLSEVQMAKLFNQYFKYSNGIAGTTLGGWLANIQKITGKNLIIQSPNYPTLDVFESIDEDWVRLIRELVFHKRMGKTSIERVTKWTPTKVDTVLLAMQR